MRRRPPSTVGTRAALSRLPVSLALATEVLWRSGRDFLKDELDQWAGAVAFQAFLSLFPMLLATVALASQLVDPTWVASLLEGPMTEVLPGSAKFVRQTVQDTFKARGSIGLISLVVLLWTGSRVFSALTVALNVAYDVDETFGFARRTALHLLMTVTVGAFFVAAMTAMFMLGRLDAFASSDSAARVALFKLLSFVAALLMMIAALFLVYRFVPRGKQSSRAALVGAVVASGLFLIARPIWSHYVNVFADYDLVYGSIGVVILLLLWTWAAALIVLFGGEVASHYEMIVLQGRSGDDVQALHERRSAGLNRAAGRPAR